MILSKPKLYVAHQRQIMWTTSLSAQTEDMGVFPPSKHNLNFLQIAAKSTGKLYRHYEELQDGTCAVLAPRQAICLPTGYLYPTYCLKGSMTIGTTWSLAEGLVSTANGLVEELYPDARVPVTGRSDIVLL